MTNFYGSTRDVRVSQDSQKPPRVLGGWSLSSGVITSGTRASRHTPKIYYKSAHAFSTITSLDLW